MVTATSIGVSSAPMVKPALSIATSTRCRHELCAHRHSVSIVTPLSVTPYTNPETASASWKMSGLSVKRAMLAEQSAESSVHAATIRCGFHTDSVSSLAIVPPRTLAPQACNTCARVRKSEYFGRTVTFTFERMQAHRFRMADGVREQGCIGFGGCKLGTLAGWTISRESLFAARVRH